MKIIIDSRETGLYEKCSLCISKNRESSSQLLKKQLDLGDIYITTDSDMDVCIMERKTISDLLSSIKDGRYEEQSYRLSHATNFHSHNIIYIIEGMIHTFLPHEKKIFYSAITSLQYYKGFSVFRTSCLQETAELILGFSEKVDKNFLKKKAPFFLNHCFVKDDFPPYPKDNDDDENDDDKEQKKEKNTTTNNKNAISDETSLNILDDENLPPPKAAAQRDEPSPLPPPLNNNTYASFVKKVKKENVTPSNIDQIMLSQIPGISDVSASAILAKYNTIYQLLQEVEKDSHCLDDIFIESNNKKRKIGKNVIESIQKYLKLV